MNHDTPPPTPVAGTTVQPQPWETWGIAARWNPQHHWHAPDEATL